jgi:AraC family transcriptional regulator, transcriptional activator of pobA
MGYPRLPGRPPVTVERWTGADARAAVTTIGTHAHDFLTLLYVERGEGPVRVDGRDWPLEVGDALVIAPGAVIAAPGVGIAPDAAAWTVFFPADAVDPAGAAPLVSWQPHPLLAPFVGARRGGAQRLPVAPEQQAAWSAQLGALADECDRRRDGYAEAVRAHLTVLLVWLGRLAADAPGSLVPDPLLAGVFDVIERRYADLEPPIGLREVADEVGLTTGHLATVVKRRTGRTVGQWINERRMREARRLLADTDLTVTVVARRVGYRDPGYFVRRFRTEHGVPPLTWRRA